MNTSTKLFSYSLLVMSGEMSTCAGATTRSNLGLCPEQVKIQIRMDVNAEGMASGLIFNPEHTVRQLPSGEKELIMRSKRVICWVGYPAGQYRFRILIVS